MFFKASDTSSHTSFDENKERYNSEYYTYQKCSVWDCSKLHKFPFTVIKPLEGKGQWHFVSNFSNAF